MAPRRFAAEGALVVAAFLFGITFPLVHDALEDVTPFGYLVLRFAIAVIVLAPFAVLVARRDGVERRQLVRVGVVAGLLLFGGYATQTVGLQYTTPSTSAFITGLYVVFTPFVAAIVERSRPSRRIVGAAVVATLGLYMLTGADVALGRGELLTLACALIFAIWIVYQGRYATRIHPVPFTTLQMVTLVLVGVPAAVRQGLGDLSPTAWFAIVFTGVACSAVALSLQLWGQRRIPPARAALILLLEPVFAGLVSFVDGERLGSVELLGAVVILGAIVLAELGPRRATVVAG
ncbi:MAG: DMT family transporter [Actinobacteria bacterium]|nr:DMT family transporter [Actinomycetota bacterium]